MAIPQGTVRYHQQGLTVTFRVEGRATMANSVPLRRCAERLLGEGSNQVRVDLRDCNYMDSTFLGTLLTINKALEKTQGHLTLIAPSLACSRILDQMGLTDILPAQADPLDPQAGWTDVGDAADPGALKRNVVQAHEELASLPGPAGEQFKAVVRCLAEASKVEKPPQ